MHDLRHKASKFARSRYGFIAVIIGINIVLGGMMADDHGESWDERQEVTTGQRAIEAFQGTNDYTVADVHNYYGPFYNMLVQGSVGLFGLILPDALPVTARHFTNFLTFQLAILSLYVICLRFTGQVAALGSALLFATQPLLFGHGFINPKDAPLMAFFLAAVAVGLAMVAAFDQAQAPPSPAEQDSRWKRVLQVWRTKSFTLCVITGGLLVGLATSIRVIGLFSGILVSGYFLFKARATGALALLVYWACAALAIFVTWPYLWSAPVWHFLESLWVMAHFVWPGEVLFGGMIFESGTLPLSYVPTMLVIQVTEPVLILFVIGLAASLRRIGSGAPDGPALVLIILAWFILPLALHLTSGLSVYDNTRHLLYMLPSLFVVSAIGIDTLMNILKSPSLKTIALLLILVPGVLAIVRLQPYEYAYYNAVVGGVQGAFRTYELDYWCTSYKEAVAHMNQTAPPETEIAFWGQDFTVTPYIRDDLIVYPVYDQPGAQWQSEHDPDYAVICTRANMDLRLFPEAPVVWEARHGDAVYAVVKKLN